MCIVLSEEWFVISFVVILLTIIVLFQKQLYRWQIQMLN